jgi:hypothetical protein
VGVRRGRWKTVCARGADQAPARGPSTSPLDVAASQCVGSPQHLGSNVFDVIGDFLSSLIIGWRSAVGLACGIALACLIAWIRPPQGGQVRALVVLAVLCYLVGLWAEFSAHRRRRRDRG